MTDYADLIAYAKTTDIWSDPLVQDLTAALEAAARDNAAWEKTLEAVAETVARVSVQRDELAAQNAAAREALDKAKSDDAIRRDVHRILSASDAGAILRDRDAATRAEVIDWLTLVYGDDEEPVNAAREHFTREAGES